ncbi:hypothetical protein [Lysobacter gummosus]
MNRSASAGQYICNINASQRQPSQIACRWRGPSQLVIRLRLSDDAGHVA